MKINYNTIRFILFLYIVITLCSILCQQIEKVEITFHVNNGTAASDRVYSCGEQVVNVMSASFIMPRTTMASFNLQNKLKCTDENIVWKLRGKTNFRHSIPQTFLLDCLYNATGKLSMAFQCVNATKDCNSKCAMDGTTCIHTVGSSECTCLQVPDESWNYPICSSAIYSGCHNLSGNNPDYRIQFSKLLFPPACVQLCQMLGYQYAVVAGLKTGCLCQRSINNTQILDETNCLAACSYRPQFSCGTEHYGHVYNTSIRKNSSTCENQSLCPNGTTCIDVFDSYMCLCDPTRKEFMPPKCYGCLDGWFTTEDWPVCYKVADFTSNVDKNCASIHGQPIDVNIMSSFKTLMFFTRMLINEYISMMNSGIKDEFFRTFGINGNDFEWVADQLPICQRKKSPVMGKFPWAMWPDDSFGLPMPKTGCPLGYKFDWRQGQYKQDTENTDNENNKTIDSNLYGSVNKDYIEQGFCIKEGKTNFNVKWPEGRYCVYKKGPCPLRMSTGEIYWDDEDVNNTNKASNTLPDGMFKADTIINFCCSLHEINYNGIILPRDKPFYLFPYGSKTCQPVVGTTVRLEYIQYDLENDFGDINSLVAFNGTHPFAEFSFLKQHLILYYCFYQPVSSCGSPSLSDLLVTYAPQKYLVGDVLRYQCLPGYHNKGDSIDICLESEVWSSINGPRCVDINECEDGKSNSCHVKANCYNTDGSYSCMCNPGWEGDGRDCKIVTCKKPILLNGDFISDQYQETFFPQTILDAKCDKGYILNGCNRIRCLLSGQWDFIPECIDQTTCVNRNYLCTEMKYLPIYNYQTYSCCSCTRKPANQTSTKKPHIRIQNANWTKTIIAVVFALVGFILIVIFGLFLLIRLKRKDMEATKRGRKSTQSNSSIYADIEELQLNVALDNRKESSSSNVTSTTEFRSNPMIPPRNTSLETTSVFTLPEKLTFRRQSEFGSSDSCLVAPNQFSTILDGEKEAHSPPLFYRYEQAEQQATQYKLTSISSQNKTRRSSEFRMPRPYQQNFLFNMKDLTTHLTQSIDENDESGSESPYIHIVGGGNDSDSDNNSLAAMEDHYKKVTRNTVLSDFSQNTNLIAEGNKRLLVDGNYGNDYTVRDDDDHHQYLKCMRIRSKTLNDTSKTGTDVVRQTYSDHFQKKRKTRSLPEMVATDHSRNDSEIQCQRLVSQLSAGSDDVFLCQNTVIKHVLADDMETKKSSSFKQKPTSVKRLSFMLKFNIHNKMMKNQANSKERRISFSEKAKNFFSSKDSQIQKKFKSNSRFRSDTNPF